MTDTTTMGHEMQDEILNTVRKTQTAVVDAIQTWASAVQSMTPSLPDVKLPFAEKLPKAEDLIASAYDFAEQMLASQRKFAEGILTAAAPMFSGQDQAPARQDQASGRKNGTAAAK